MSSQLSSLIVPTLFAQTLLEDSIQKNKLVSSGIIADSAVMASFLAGAGSVFTFPSLINPDLAKTAANVPTGDSSVLATPETITGHAQKFVKNARNKTYNVNGLVVNVIGKDPVSALMAAVSPLMNQWRQASLVNQLDALLSKSGAAVSANAHVIASESVAGQGAGTKLSSAPLATILDTLYGAFGDQDADGTVLIMHSDVYRTLMKANSTTFTPLASQLVQFKNFLGYACLVDDNIGKRAGTTDGFVYTVYAVKAGGIEFGYAAPAVPFEIQQAVLQGNGAGGEIIAIRDMFSYHVPGTSFTGSFAGDVPTDAELGTASKWSLINPTKTVGIAALVCNL